MRTPENRSAIFRPGLRAAVWIVVGISVIATIVAILFGGKLAQPVPGMRDSYAHGPLGNRAFVETLEALGMHVLREREGDFKNVRAPLMFVEPTMTEAVVDGERVGLGEAIDRRAEAGLASIVVLPKWRLAETGGGMAATPDSAAEDVLKILVPGARLEHSGEIDGRVLSASASGTMGSYTLALPWPQWIANSDGTEVLLANSEGHALVVRCDDGVIVVSDPDLVHNWNLHRADNARVLVDVLGQLGASDTVALDEVFHGHGQRRSLASALGEYPTVLLTAHALFVLLLIVWIGSRRFGPPRDFVPLGKGPQESIAVSAFVLSEGRPITTLVERYVYSLVADLAERLGLEPGRSANEQAAHIDRIAKNRGETVFATALLANARTLATASRSGNRPKNALALARAAHGLHARLLSRKQG